MPVPFKSYMKLVGGSSSTNSNIHEPNPKILVGDTIKITGTTSNNGVFTVMGINDDGTDVYYSLKGRAITSESSPAGNPEIEVVRATGDKLVAAGNVDGANNINVWSDNATTDYTSAGNGWESIAISPTLSGNDAKYIYYFIDEALRVCNIEERCESRIKWYGYIQKHQFANANIGVSPTFTEWQEHPNTLKPPKVTGTLTYAIGGTNFTAATAANYYKTVNDLTRGVAIHKQAKPSSSVVDLLIDKPNMSDLPNLLHADKKTWFNDVLDSADQVFDFGGNNDDGTTNLLDSDGFISDSTATVSFAVSSGKGVITNTASNRGFCYVTLITVVGISYEASFDVVAGGNSAVSVTLNSSADTAGGSSTGAIAHGSPSENNTTTTPFIATSTTSYLVIRLDSGTSSEKAHIDNLQVSKTNSFAFEDGSGGNDVLDNANVGEVITIDESLGTVPKEYLLCIQESGTNGDIPQYKRSYGGALVAGTAPDTYADEDTPIIERGVGWNIAVADGTDDGQWLPDKYEFYETFIYDGNQESLPVQIGDGEGTALAAFQHTASGGKKLRVAVYADLAYNGRVTGGRIYIRSFGSDDDLSLLADIDIESGVRTSLTGDYVSWTYEAGKGYNVIGEATGNLTSPNIDTYSSINGYSYQSKFISIGGVNEMYKDAVIANRRTFIVNVRTAGFTGEIEKYGDRLMYSEINKFDTFVEDNFIDVSKGDYGEYVAVKTFADRLLAFKHNLVHIINISSPNPSSWYLEDTIKYSGINYKYSVTNTKYGVAWVSDSGCYLYDGEQIHNLIEKKLGVNEVTNSDSTAGNVFRWSDFSNGSLNFKNTMVGYDGMSNSLVIVRSPSDDSTYSNNGFIYDFNTNGWTHLTDNLLTDSFHYSNFFTDWNNNLCIAKNISTTSTTFHKFLQIPIASPSQKLYTRDIDFGDPSTVKKIYAVTITYKSPSQTQANPLKYAVGGKQSFSSFATKTLAATDDWDIATFTASSPISCNTIQFLIDLPSTGIFEINEISIEYRMIRGKTISDG